MSFGCVCEGGLVLQSVMATSVISDGFAEEREIEKAEKGFLNKREKASGQCLFFKKLKIIQNKTIKKKERKKSRALRRDHSYIKTVG